MAREKRSLSLQSTEGKIFGVGSSSTSSDNPSQPKRAKRARSSSTSSSSDKRKRGRLLKLEIGIPTSSQSASRDMLLSPDSVSTPATKEDQPGTPTSHKEEFVAVSGGSESPPKDPATMAGQNSPAKVGHAGTDPPTVNPAAGTVSSSTRQDSTAPPGFSRKGPGN